MPRGIYKRRNGKMGKPRKKKDTTTYTTKLLKPKSENFKLFDPANADLGRGNEISQTLSDKGVEPVRASKNASVFVDDCRLFVRNMTDIKLINERASIQTELYRLRQRMEALQEISHEMWKELKFRELN